jgi:CheY-like chemotaxis protein
MAEDSEISQLLEDEGYRVTQVLDEDEAIETARAVPPGLILMDVSRPSRDGLLAARRICRRAKLRDVPIVIVDRADFHGHVNCIGNNEYVAHLNDLDRLEDLLCHLLSRGRAAGTQ